jgi:hypothetical protein
MVNGENLNLETDFLPLSFSANAQASGKVVFVGYGFEIETNEFTWTIIY